MRFVFKTDYDQDIRLFRDRNALFWYALLAVAVLAAPFLFDEYALSQVSFVLIYAIAGVGLMVLSGFTGQISLGHAAFMAAGAYTEAVLLEHGVPFAIAFPAAGIVAGLLGVALALPTMRLAGIYLAIATLAFAFIVEEVVARWDSVTHGNIGMLVEPITVFGFDLSGERPFYFLCLAVLVLVLLAVRNLLRAPTGRAFIAIRDSETAARSMGVNIAKYRAVSFAISAAVTGLAGALFAHRLMYISPEAFTIFLSIELLVVVVVGGLGSLHGAVFGAAFVILLPQAVVMLKDVLPPEIGTQTGLQTLLFGLALILFMLFEPQGLYGRWVKIKLYFSLFPLYKKATFRRQKSYMRTERR